MKKSYLVREIIWLKLSLPLYNALNQLLVNSYLLIIIHTYY